MEVVGSGGGVVVLAYCAVRTACIYWMYSTVRSLWNVGWNVEGITEYSVCMQGVDGCGRSALWSGESSVSPISAARQCFGAAEVWSRTPITSHLRLLTGAEKLR